MISVFWNWNQEIFKKKLQVFGFELLFQRILKADVGMDFEDFKNMLLIVLRNRISRLKENDEGPGRNCWLWRMDVSCVQDLLRLLSKHVFFQNDETLIQVMKDVPS